MLKPQFILPLADELVVDLFAGGGGASTGSCTGPRGSPESYVIDRCADGRLLTKAEQVRMCGNSVCPPLARAIVEANYTDHVSLRRAA